VQQAQGFCNNGAKVQSSTVVLLLNFSAKLQICASIAPPSQSPKTLYDTPERHHTFKHIWFFQPHKSFTKNQKSLNFSNAPKRNQPEPQKKSTNYFTKLKL
jgi:hypothetical protein